MRVPSLFDIASEVVVQNFFKRAYDDADFQLPPEISNSLIKGLRKNSFRGTKAALVISERLNVTEVDLREQPLDMNDLRYLSSLNRLEVLKLGWCDEVDQQYFNNTPLLLTDCVNEQSRRTLRHISFVDFQCPKSLLTEAVLNMSRDFSNVTSLDFNEITFNDTQFGDFCKHFPRLKQMYISRAEVRDFTGISMLSQLEVLSIDNWNIKDNAGLRELCQLKRLRVLDAGLGAINGVFRCLSALVQEGIVPLPSLEELDCTGSDVQEHMFRLIETWIPSLRLICLSGTPLNVVRLKPVNQHLTILNSATMEEFLRSIQYYRCREKTPSMNLAVEAYHRDMLDLLTGMRENGDITRKLIEELNDVAIILNQDTIGTGWMDVFEILGVLYSPPFFDDLTRYEFHTIVKLYRRSHYELVELHEYYWTCLGELCRRSILEMIDQDEVLKNSVELLKKSKHAAVLSLVYDFFGEVFKNPKYSQLYKDFLRTLHSSVSLSEDFCKKYLEHRMFETLYCNLNFYQSLQEALLIRMVHMKILFRVFTTVRGSAHLLHFCKNRMVYNLLSIFTSQRCIPFDPVAHYAFAILWMTMKTHGEFVHPDYRRSFERTAAQKPLRERFVWELIGHRDDEELLWHARDYYSRYF